MSPCNMYSPTETTLYQSLMYSYSKVSTSDTEFWSTGELPTLDPEKNFPHNPYIGQNDKK